MAKYTYFIRQSVFQLIVYKQLRTRQTNGNDILLEMANKLFTRHWFWVGGGWLAGGGFFCKQLN